MKRLLIALLFLAAGPAQAAPDGPALYDQYCAGCHGMDGRGGVGVPLALPDFQRDVSDEYIFRTIRNGRPGRVMPAHKALSDAQIDAIVAHVRSFADTVRPEPVYTTIPGNAEHGEKLFAQHCASCHGENGGGGHGTGVTFSRPRDFPIIPPALNNRGFLASASDHMIKRTLMTGREGTPMVSFIEAGMSEGDINDLVAYIRSLEADPLPREHEGRHPEPFLMMESYYSLEETVEAVKRAAVGKNFRIIRETTLEDGLFPEGEENPKQVIVHFCNFSFINKALTLDPRVGLFMPCRITVVEWEGEVKLLAMNPRYMSRIYNNSELDQACTEMHDLYISIMEEATL